MYMLIPGGAGFIGTNLAARLVALGREVVIYDSLVREGVAGNLRWMKERAGRLLTHVEADVRDADRLAYAVRGAEAVFHLAAQVAVTHSLIDPAADFAVNALGTLNVLEAVRACSPPPRLVLTSTNKVYGDLRAALVEGPTRWEPADPALRSSGVPETQPLDFRSPYGCSKGAADQYVLDYARSYAIPAVVFRMSCIYGPHQCGNEAQGWLAHFARCALGGEPVTVYGDGKQVRDALYVEDLVEALLLAEEHAPRLGGQAFNIGGGPEHTTSLVELLDLLREITGRSIAVKWGDWRTGDQRWYVSDSRRFHNATGWQASTPVRNGVHQLLATAHS